MKISIQPIQPRICPCMYLSGILLPSIIKRFVALCEDKPPLVGYDAVDWGKLALREVRVLERLRLLVVCQQCPDARHPELYDLGIFSNTIHPGIVVGRAECGEFGKRRRISAASENRARGISAD